MANCDTQLAAHIDYDACKPATKGLKAIGYIANFADVDKSAMTKITGKNSYSNFALVEGKKLYKVYQAGKNPFTGATTEAQVGDYRTTWNKTIPFILLNNGSDVTANIVDKIANGSFVMVVENAHVGTGFDNQFEIVGLETGLKLTEGNAEKYNDDYGGGWQLTLVEENAPTSGLYLEVTAQGDNTPTAAATRASLESLLAPTT